MQLASTRILLSRKLTEAFVTKLKLDTGERRYAYKVEADKDTTIGGLCATDPAPPYKGALYAVGTTSGQLVGADNSVLEKYNMFVVGLKLVTMTVNLVTTSTKWKPELNWQTKYDLFGGGCVATKTGVHVFGTMGSSIEST